MTTASGARHRAPTPLDEMDNPVLEVLEGIRVQRMSLVQSLRQFVFVHRGQSSLLCSSVLLMCSYHDCVRSASR
jgi:protein tyrosine phosphatase